MSVRRSACGEGLRPRDSSCANTNASIGFFTQAASFTDGTAGRRTGWNAQCVR